MVSVPRALPSSWLIMATLLVLRFQEYLVISQSLKLCGAGTGSQVLHITSCPGISVVEPQIWQAQHTESWVQMI